MKDFRLLQQQYIVNTYPNRGLTITSGKGVYLYDENNNEYLDMMSNYGVSIFGHAHPTITKILGDQLQKITVLHSSFANDTRSLAAQALVQRCNNDLAVYFSNSGAEAIEASLKFATLITGKKKFIACKKGYHGKTLGALSATYGDKYQAPFRPLIWNFTHIPYNNPEALEKAISEDTAAFIVEPVQGEGGITPAEKGYLQKVREICTQNNVLLIIDEIQTGVGRTGRFLASQSENIEYDMVCLGKGLAGGIPIGATLVSKKLSTNIPRGSHTSTFGGNPLACAGILATLQLLDEERLQHISEIGAYFVQQLKLIRSSHIKAVRGVGLMLGVEVDINRDEVLKQLQKKGILAIPASDSVVRFLPPYIISKQEVDRTVKGLKEVLETM